MTKRIGIWGTGGIARRHAKAISETNGCELVAVCGRAMEKAEQLAADSPQANVAAFDDYERFLDESRLNVLYHCVTPDAQQGQAEAAAQRGIHLFLEKPVALDPAKVAAISEACEEAGVKAQVGHHLRFGSAVRRVKRLIESGDAGVPTLFSGRWWCNMWGGDWWRDPQRSGGQTIEQVIHIYDLAHHLFGRVAEVSGRVANLAHADKEGYHVEDTAAGLLQFENDAIGVVTGSNASTPKRWLGECRLVCSNLTAHLDGGNAGVIERYDDRPDADVDRVEHEEDVDMYAAALRNLLSAIDGDERLISPLSDAAHTTAIAVAVGESSRNGGAPVRPSQ